MITRLLITFYLVMHSTLVLSDTQISHATMLADAAEKMDKVNYLPALLPVIMQNQEFIGLNDEQLEVFDKWRRHNKAPMVAAMQSIIEKRIAIKEGALSPNVSPVQIRQYQDEIFSLQRQVLDYKLACRENMMKTFTNENWISFFMVLSDMDTGINIPTQLSDASL